MRKIPHLLIGGTTGSGKTVLMNNIIFNIYNCYSNKGINRTFELYIIDTKQSLNAYGNVKNTRFFGNTKEAIEVLRGCCRGMDYLYRHKEEAVGIDRYIVIDELADLMLTSKYEVEQSLVRLAQLGRECNIHLIVATQNPKVEVCSGLIKANMPYRIALKTASVRESVVLLDHKGAEDLEGQGDCILKLNGKETRCLVAMPNEQDIAYMIGVMNETRS